MALQSQSQSQSQSAAVAPETISRAVDALVKWTKSKALEQKAQLLEQDEFMYLVLTLKKIPPKGRTNPHKIPLPHPPHPLDASQELCLIIDDRPKSSLTSEAAKKKIHTDNIPISKVLKLSKLKSDYRPFEAKRKLCSSYDLFFADKRVIPMLPRCLGKEFFKKKKIPIAVDLGRNNWKDQVETACASALLFLRSGTCSVVKVARIGQSIDDIVDNVRGVIDGAAHIVPRKWANIRSFHLKVSGSVALPIYQTVPELGLKIEGLKEEKNVESQGESADEEFEKKEGSKKSKRGRIHQVRYMDNKVGEEFDDILSGKEEVDKDDDHKTIAGDALELQGELIGKKRKKSAKLKKKDLVDQNGEEELKRLGKPEKEETVKKKKKKIAISTEEVDREDDNENVELTVTNGFDKSSKFKERAAKKKTSNVVDGKEDAELHVGVEKPAKLKEASKLKKHGLTKTKGGKQDADDDEEVGGTSVSGDQKKKKNKAGKTDSKGVKLKTKKSKLV